MSENLMNTAHKTSNQAYRDGYDGIRWDLDEAFREGIRHWLEHLHDGYPPPPDDEEKQGGQEVREGIVGFYD